ncbi:hypothetical protein OROGR_004500 [Orobanche gracilis]
MAARINSSFSCLSLSSTLQRRPELKLSSKLGWFDKQHLNTESLITIKVVELCQPIRGTLTVSKKLSKRHCNPFATYGDQESFGELDPDDIEQEKQVPPTESSTSQYVSYDQVAQGKSGLVSFYGDTQRGEDEVLVSRPVKKQNNLLWLVGPTILVASFVFPSLYLRRVLSSIFEDSLLTDFLILFFTETIFYSGVAIFLLLIDRLSKPKDPKYAATNQNQNLVPHLGYQISSVAVLVLSLIIPTVTMGFVWPWTGPAASATLAPYLVGTVVQYAFEQYARYADSPSWPAIPIVFQIYRLHQLNRAAQLVTALSFTVRGAEMTPHNAAINGSLSTLLNVLQFLGVISIWSLSSFVMRYLPSATTTEQ